MIAYNVLWFRLKIGEILGFCLSSGEQFKEVCIAAFLFGLKPYHMRKFLECWLTDIGEHAC